MNKTFKSIKVVALFICCFLASGLFLTSCLAAARQPLVVISNTEQSPSKIFAGETLTQKFNLTNVGNEDAKMILLSLDISYPFLIMGSSSNFFIGDLEPEEGRSVSVEILVDKDANGLYYIDFTITYKDDDGESYTESGAIFIEVFGRPQIDVREVDVGQSSSKIFTGDTFTESFTLTNLGDREAKMVQLSLNITHPFAMAESSRDLFVGDIVEAMACGLPVVCYDAPFVREMFSCPAVLRTPIDDIDGAVALVCDLLKDEEKRRRLGHQALEYVKRYEWGEVAKKEARIYRIILNQSM